MSNSTNLYDVIFKRKSIRKYRGTPLESSQLEKISAYINTLKPLHDNIKTEIKIVSPGNVKGLIQVKAPHYLVAFSENKEGYLANIGFMLQQMDLFFAANGIGCCWQGWPKPVKEIRTDKNLEFVIVLAFGLPDEILYRDINQFKRKPIEKISNIRHYHKTIEAARLAPSPSQPWYFTGDKKSIDICCVKNKGLISKMSKTFSQMEDRLKVIEIGISMCHLWIAFQHFKTKITFNIKDELLVQVPDGYFYVISADILEE